MAETLIAIQTTLINKKYTCAHFEKMRGEQLAKKADYLKLQVDKTGNDARIGGLCKKSLATYEKSRKQDSGKRKGGGVTKKTMTTSIETHLTPDY